VIAVLEGGPRGGAEILIIGVTAPSVLGVPDRPVAPVDLGPPAPGERITRLAYRYTRSLPQQDYTGPMHLYELVLTDDLVKDDGAALD
jgi:hypothetical protein